MVPLLGGLVLLGACGGDTAPLAVTPADPLPAVAPAVELFATLEADGDISVGGALQGEFWVDLDDPHDERDGFRYVVLDAAGVALYARSTPGPLIVRDFLAHYGEQSGYDLLTLLPDLGRFPVLVPLIEGAATVDFQVRDASGGYVPVGHYALADVAADDRGVSDAVVSTETLYDAGPADQRLDLVLVGDGYTAAQMDDWRDDAASLADELLSTAPFSDFPDGVNIHRVDVESAESGVSYDCTDTCRMRDTALKSVFPLEVVNAITGTNYRTEAIFQLDQWEVARVAGVVPADFVGVIANTPHDGGFAVHFATVTTSRRQWPATGVHELGHLLGLLGDEYASDDCIRSPALGLPVNITDTPAAPPWADWIDPETPLPTPETRDYRDAVGAYAPAYNCDDLYRPAQGCRMLSSEGDPFCPVCTEQLVRRLFRYQDPAEGVDVEVHGGRADFSLRAPVPGAAASWYLDGDLAGVAPTFTVRRADLGPGPHTVTGVATLVTDRVRIPNDDLSQAWSFRVE